MMRSKLINLLKHLSLSTHYIIFANGVLIAIALFSLLTGISDYNAYQQNELNISANRLDSALTSIFDTTYHMQIFMGRQIAQQNADNLDYIYKLFKNNSDIRSDVQTLYSWPLYDWTNTHKMLVVNTRTGIQSTDFTNRTYLQKTFQYPWKLWLSDPLLGFPSGEWVIVAAVGVTDTQGQYLGSIGVGINIHRLAQALQTAINSNAINFIIVNDKGKIITASDSNLLNANAQSFTDPKVLNQNEGVLKHPIENDHNVYSYYHKMANYPYYVIVGNNSQITSRQFSSLLLPRLLEFAGISLISLIFIVIFKRWFIQPISQLSQQAANLAKGKLKFQPTYSRAPEIINLSKGLLQVKRYIQHNNRIQRKLSQSNQALITTNQELSLRQMELQKIYQQLEHAMQIAKDSDNAKEQFIRQVNADLKTPIITVLKNTEYLIAWLEEQTEISYLQKEHLPYLQQILAAILELKAFTRSILQLSPTDIKTLINECIRIHNKVTLDKKIRLEIKFDDFIPAIYADELRLKQALVGLLYRAIDNTPANGLIKVTCNLINNVALSAEHIEIVIEDSGFGLNEADRNRIKTKFATTNGTDGTDLELEVIQKIIDLHQGEFHTTSEWQQGTRVTILLPCVQQNTIHNLPHTIKKIAP